MINHATLSIHLPSGEIVVFDLDAVAGWDDLTCNGVPTVRLLRRDTDGTSVEETFKGFPFHVIEDKS